MVYRVAVRTPAVLFERFIVKGPGMYPVVYFRPVGVSRLRPEAIVVGHPGWPTEFLAKVRYCFLVQEKGGGPFWVP